MDEETVRVDDPDPPEERLTLAGFIDAVRPDCETAAVRNTVPEKLLRLARLIVDVPVEPEEIVRLEGLLEMLKSGVVPELTVTVVEAEPVAPLESVTDKCTV